MDVLAKSAFIADHYLRLGVLLVSAFGVGDLALRSLLQSVERQALVRASLACATGMAVLILLILGLGLVGQFNVVALGVLFGAAFALGVYRAVAWIRLPVPSGGAFEDLAQLGRIPRWAWLAILAALLPYFIRPLVPPLEWDEVAYHLPYVRFWAERGELSINEWLRYPYFPYSYHMLYVAAYILGSDVLPHLVHGLAGWLTALMILGIGVRHYGPATGVLAMVLFIASAGASQFSAAYIDLALTLFVNASLYALLVAHEQRRTGWLYVSALFIGTAVGIKYQAALFAFAWVVLLVIVERRASRLLLAVLVSVLSGGYWYLRNVLLTGDPFHPVGGPLFGFYLWDAIDLKGQLIDVRKRIELPLPILWIPAAAALLLVKSAPPLTRWLLAVSAYGVLTWLATSGHERYLIPTFPALSLLAAYALASGVRRMTSLPAWNAMRGKCPRRLAAALPLLFVTFALLASLNQAKKAWGRITPTPEDRDRVIPTRLPGYEIFKRLSQDASVCLYQIGFEEQLYYAPPGTIGDHFGPGRYRTVYELASNPAALAAHFRKLGVNTIVISSDERGHRNLRFPPDAVEYFELVDQTPQYRLYRLKPSESEESAQPDCGGRVLKERNPN